jgi:hypothetical protein
VTGALWVLAAAVAGAAVGLWRRGAPALVPLRIVSAPSPSRDARPVPAYAASDRQNTCDPTPKPGTKALRDYVLNLYGGRSGGIFRACAQGGLKKKSEHKEGRAWDWFPKSKADGDRMVSDLLAKDIHGNPHAEARRRGIQYLIWYGRIWIASKASRESGPEAGWKPYGRKGMSVTALHKDHVHLSQSREAAARGPE